MRKRFIFWGYLLPSLSFLPSSWPSRRWDKQAGPAAFSAPSQAGIGIIIWISAITDRSGRYQCFITLGAAGDCCPDIWIHMAFSLWDWLWKKKWICLHRLTSAGLRDRAPLTSVLPWVSSWAMLGVTWFCPQQCHAHISRVIILFAPVRISLSTQHVGPCITHSWLSKLSHLLFVTYPFLPESRAINCAPQGLGISFHPHSFLSCLFFLECPVSSLYLLSSSTLCSKSSPHSTFMRFITISFKHRSHSLPFK